MARLSYREALNQAMREEMERDADDLPHGRRGRPLPGRLQGLAGHAAEVRREARHRHADRRVRLRRRRHRRGDDRPAADHRADDVELLARRDRSDRQQRGQDPPDVGRAVQDADRVPRPGRRRRAARRAALAVPRVHVRQRARAEGGDAVDAGRRQGPAQDARSATTTRSSSSRASGSTGCRARCPTASTWSRSARATSSAPGQRLHHRRLVEDGAPRRSRRPRSLAKENISVEVVDPRTIRPLDEEIIFASVRKTDRCVIVEEGHGFAGVGAEIVARVQRALLRRSRRAGRARAPRWTCRCPTRPTSRRWSRPTSPRVVAAVKRAMYLRSRTDGLDHHHAASSLRRWKRACSRSGPRRRATRSRPAT